MRTLVPLIKLISGQKIGQIQIIPDQSESNSKFFRLYDAVRTNKIKSDQEAIKFLGYGGNKTKSYNKLKARLKTRLINTLFFIDISSYAKSEYQIEIHNCYKNFAAVQILLERLQRIAAIELAEATLRKALKFDISLIVMSLSRELLRHYQIFDRDSNRVAQYDVLFNQYKRTLIAESEADAIYIYFVAKYLYSKGVHKDSSLEDFFSKLILLKKNNVNVNSYYFTFYFYSALYFYYLIKKEPNEIIKVCEEAISFFSTKHGFLPMAEFNFWLRLGLAQIIQANFRKAEEAFRHCYKMPLTFGTLNWFHVRYYLFLSLILQHKYQEAYEIFVEGITATRHFKKLMPIFREQWLIKEAYIHFLIRLGKIDPDKSTAEKKPRKFRLSRFLNDLPTFSKDKRGRNISILIIQLLFLIQDKKYDEITERLNALNLYCHRYLKKDQTLRSNAFIKMLMILPDAEYHPIRVERYVKRYHEKLVSTPMEISEQSTEIEVIPYEHLWELVMEVLEKNKKF